MRSIALICLISLFAIFCLAPNNASSSSYLWLQRTPAPAPPNTALFDWLGYQQPSGTVPTHAKGWAWVIPWSAVEPQDGVFNWLPITQAEALLSAGQFLQVHIMTGQSSPTSTAACTAATTYYPGATGCTPWLKTEGVTGVATKWDYTTPFISSCADTFEPDPHDNLYQTKLEALFTAFETQFSGDTKIALVSIQPMSHWGFDLSIGAKNTKCAQNYNTAWGNLCTTAGVCANNTDETGWRTYVEGAFNAIWDAEKTTLHDQNLMLWAEPALVLNISTNAQDPTIASAMFAHAAANKPANGTYQCGNESMNNNGGWANIVTTYCQGADGWGGQGHASIDQDCTENNGLTNLSGSMITNGKNQGADWAQPYNISFSVCPTTIGTISTAFGGP